MKQLHSMTSELHAKERQINMHMLEERNTDSALDVPVYCERKQCVYEVRNTR